MTQTIDSLFAHRRKKWWAQNLKYLRYVFNDHFVLVLMFLVGFLAYQYAALLKQLPPQWWPGYLIAALVSVLVLVVGRLSTFVVSADQQFLLAKESAVQAYLKKQAVRQSMSAPVLLILVVTLSLNPLIRLPLVLLVLWTMLLIVIKYALLVKRANAFIQQGLIQWQPLIAYEQNRQNARLKVFSQFTDVKGLQQKAKRRRYLDRLLPPTTSAYTYLFSRTFLRSGDYLMLTLRLLGLSLLALTLSDQPVFAILLALLFNYLLVFQLLPLAQSQDYQLLTRLYPLPPSAKQTAAHQVISRLMLTISALESLVALVSLSDPKLALVFIVTGGLLGVAYPKWKLPER
jgi:ABC-2 type transport system permease protein